MMVKKIAGCLLLLSSNLWAQDNALFSFYDDSDQWQQEDVFDVTIPSVVTPSQIAQPRADVSSTLSVLDGEFIRRVNVQYVEDLLQFVPGFVVVPYHNTSGIIVSYHGTQLDRYRRIQVLINGRTVYSTGIARVDWASLPINIEDVSRVEVNRGPNAATYGVNSFFAVVNIITRSPLETLGNSISAYSGKNGDYRVYGQHSGLNDDWSYRASASRSKVSGFDEDSSGVARHDGHNREVGNVFLQKDTTDSYFDLDIGASKVVSKMDALEYPRDSEDINKPLNYTDREHIKVSYSKQVSADHEIKFKYYYDQSESRERHEVSLSPVFYYGLFNQSDAAKIAALTTGSANIESAYTLDLDEQRHDMEVQSIWRYSDQLRIITGLGYRYDQTESETYLSGKVTDEITHLSSNIEYRLTPSVIFNSGFMVESSTMNDTYFSPKAGATYKLSEQQSLRFNVSKAVRTPDIVDQNFHWTYTLETGDTSFATYALNGEQEEKVTSYEVGYYQRWPSVGMTMDIRLYHDVVTGLVTSRKQFITPSSLSDLQDHVIEEGETIDVDINGAELEVDWRGRNGAIVRFTYAHQNTLSDDHSLQNATTPILVSLFGSLPLGEKWSVQSYYIFADELSDSDYELVNAWLTYKLSLGGYYKVNMGVGAEKRIDNNWLVSGRNVLLDDSYAYIFANMTF